MTEKTHPSGERRPLTIDWEEAYRRLAAAQAALEHGVQRTADEENKILKARAQALAREPQPEHASQEYIEIVEFLLAYETYGIELAHVREVLPLKDFTPVPSTPPFVLGVINVRGQILPVIDLKKFFKLPEKGLTDAQTVIVLSDRGKEFGILADAILGVRSLLIEALQPSLPTLTGIHAEYLKGVTKERLAVLDATQILTDKKMILSGEGET